MKTIFKPLNVFAGFDTAIVGQAISDLTRVNDRNCFLAAEYFFLDGGGIDEDYPKTFTALCLRNGIDPDRAAKSIWNRLAKDQQERVLQLLKRIGCFSTIN
ncbi:MAG: hypothetical protein AAB556_01280 [Patescibacteria group bacterium]